MSILVVLALYHSGRIDSPSVGLASTSRVAVAPGAPQSTLWLLSIGVSRYRQSDFNLQFADADARAIAAALQQQSEGSLYREAKTLVLTNEEVTRESILDSMGRFFRQAGPNDMAVIFIAGHGVQDRATGSYYFLPFPATVENHVTTGMRMSDLDETVRVVRQNVRGVVLMLDTCHAGALQLGNSGLEPMDEPAARMSAGEGFFLLAATKPGEESQEQPELLHGAFTYGLLEGVQGAADADHDGVVSVSELFSYVAREVPRLTGGTQHPYHKMEGTDLSLAAVTSRGATPQGAPLRAEPLAPGPAAEALAQSAREPATTPVPNTLGVMEFHNVRADPEHDWVGKALRVAFNTELSKVRALHVYAPELIDRTARTRSADQLYTAQQLGIDRLVTGSFSIVGNTIRIDARIVDAGSGLQEGSDSVEGDLSQFFDLQKKLVLSMLRRLRVKLSPEEGTSIQNQTNTDVDAYRLLLETEEIVEQPAPSPSRRPTPPSTPADEPHSRLGFGWPSVAFALLSEAHADESALDAEAAVRRLLEAYRAALELKDLDRLATLYVSFPPSRRDALRVYLENAVGFAVELADVTIAPHGNDMAVSYTRRDRFVDKETGKSVRLEVRLTRMVVREGGTWKIAGRP